MVTSTVLTRKLMLLVTVFAVAFSVTLASAAAAQPAGPAEKMPLSEVKKGMRGYGLTVFEGTEVERFEVEILGVLENIGPEQNLILARVDSPVVRRAGIIAGMS